MITELLTLLKLSIQVRDGLNQSETPNSKFFLKYLCKKLFEVIGYKLSNKNSDMHEDQLFIHIYNLVNAVWGNEKSIKYIQSKITEYINTDNKRISNIWYDNRDKTEVILKSSLKKYSESITKSVNVTNINNRKSVIQNLDYIKAIEKKNYKAFGNFYDSSGYINYLPEEKRIYFKIGCISNISTSLISHKFMIWITCSNSMKNEVKVWIPCSEFCHAGHKLIFKSTEYNRGVCSWGTSEFKNLPIEIDNNPLSKINDYQVRT